MAVMTFPFTQEQFLTIFSQYNLAVFPLQIVFIILDIVALWFIVKKSPISDRIILLILIFFWFSDENVYHILFFSSINPLAYALGIMCIHRSVSSSFYLGIIERAGWIQPDKGHVLPPLIGLIFIVYAMIIYPVIGTSYRAQGTTRLPDIRFALAPRQSSSSVLFLSPIKNFPCRCW